MSEKHYPYYGGSFDRIVFDRDESVWVSEAKLLDVESENASLRGAAQGLGELCDRYKDENAKLREQSERLFDKTLELATENSKLRELVLVMWDVALHPQLFGDGSYLLGRMSELGIEVE